MAEQETQTLPHQESEGLVAAAREVRLSPFSREDATSWFQRAEILFRLKNVYHTGTKADYVLAALPEDIFPLMSDWIAEQGDGPMDYTLLKAELLRRFVATPEERAERLLALVRQPLGDQKPSTALQEMITLSRVTVGNETKPMDLVSVLWLLRLPDVVRQGIPKFADKSAAELGQLADSLICTYRQTNGGRVMATQEDETAAEETAAAAQTIQQQKSHQKQRSFRPQNNNIDNQRMPRSSAPRTFSTANLCYFHRRFGRDARRCESPCSWTKNL